MMWRRQRPNICLEDRQSAALDRLAAEQGISRAELIRRILDRALFGHDDHAQADLARMEYAFEAVVELDVAGRQPGDPEQHVELDRRAGSGPDLRSGRPTR
jgi:hypothetical protein